MYFKFGLVSLGLFGASSYVVYKYQESVRFKEQVFDAQPDKRQFMLQVHQFAAYNYDKAFDDYEQSSKIGQYRKFIIQYCKGKILETGVGTSRNLNYYPPGSDVTGVDWSSHALEVAMLKPATHININYRIDDVEHLSFPDNSFDTVVDTFGMEYYLNPKQALQEMKRVCKKDGLILILTSGQSTYDIINLYLEYKLPKYLHSLGYFPNRDWDKIIDDPELNIISRERKLNGTVYFYLMENNKQ